MDNDHTQPEFEKWWASQDTEGLLLSHKWSAWNAWLAALSTLSELNKAALKLTGIEERTEPRIRVCDPCGARYYSSAMCEGCGVTLVDDARSDILEP